MPAWVAFASIAIVVALTDAPRARAWCQMTSSRERGTGDCVLADPPNTFPLAWRHRCTSISLSTAGSRSLSQDDVRSILRSSLDTWETVDCMGAGPTGIHVEVLDALNTCTEATHHTDGRNVHSLLFVADGWTSERMHAREAYAVTLVWHDPQSGEIWDVDMEFNDELAMLAEPRVFGSCPPEGCPDGIVDFQNVLTHELGHYLGLAHTPDDSLATMWSMAEADETLKRDLRPDDVEGICSVYPPGSLPAECDITPRGGLGLDCQSGKCGCNAPGAGSRGGGWALVALAAIALVVARRRS